MNNAYMKKVFIRVLIFFVVSMAVLLQRSATKHIMITDAAGVHFERNSSENYYDLLLNTNIENEQSGKLIIPLPKGVDPENIVLEDLYVDNRLRIYVDSREEGFYLDNMVIADPKVVQSAVCIAENESGSVCLDFGLTGIYANESALTESGTIEVNFYKPYDRYERIVVVEAGDDNFSSQTLLGDITSELKKLADKDNTPLKIFTTSMSEKEVTVEDKKRLVEETKADLLICLESQKSNNEEKGSISGYYNGDYYLRKLTNAELADIVTRAAATEGEIDALGIFAADDGDELLRDSKIPAMRLLINNSDDINAGGLARGIYAGINKAFEEMK